MSAEKQPPIYNSPDGTDSYPITEEEAIQFVTQYPDYRGTIEYDSELHPDLHQVFVEIDSKDPDKGYISFGSGFDPEKRKTLLKLLGIGGVVVAGRYGMRRLIDVFDPGQEVDLVELESPYSHTELGHYPSGSLAGRRLGGLYKDYLNLKSVVVPETLSINFYQQLEKLWEKKIARPDSTLTVRNTGQEILKDYQEADINRTTLASYTELARFISDRLFSQVDWDLLIKSRPYTFTEIDTLAEAADKIRGHEIMAYALTELMPARDGELNVEVLDFLLRNGGREFPESIPAIYDGKTSFGLFQFTEFALFDANGETRGASIINHAMHVDEQIKHGSVAMMRGDDHLKAGWMFAVYNIMELIRRLNKDQLRVFKKAIVDRPSDLIEFIAVAHHSPGNAYTIAKRWLDNNAESAYSVSCHSRFLPYAQKTASNYQALKDRF